MMMSDRLRGREKSKKIFILSSLEENLRKECARKIHELGGVHFNIKGFKAICTHIICGKLTKSEKYLGGCATGKWVLHPDYILKSYEAKGWLDEENFEWCLETGGDKFLEDELKAAPRRWRFLLGNKGAFEGWKVAVLAGSIKTPVYRRLLISGGAEVFNLTLPVRNPEKVANTLTYLFVSQQNVGYVSHLVDYGVLCLKPEFIGDYLLKVPPPDPMDYLAHVLEVGKELPEVADTDIDINSQVSVTSDSNSTNNTSEYVSPGPLNYSVHFSQSQGLTSRKRKLGEEDIYLILHEVKKKRRFLYDGRPALFFTRTDRLTEGVFPLPEYYTSIIHTCLEEKHMMSALTEIKTLITQKYFPLPKTVHDLMTKILQNARTEHQAIRAYDVLMTVLQLHPPVTPFLQDLYYQYLGFSLSTSGRQNISGPAITDFMIQSSKGWNFIKTCMRNILDKYDGEKEGLSYERRVENNILLLRFIHGALIKNHRQYLDSIKEIEGAVWRPKRNLIAEVFWPRSCTPAMNDKCKECIYLLGDCLLATSLPVNIKFELTHFIVSLLGMLTESCFILVTGTQDRGLKCLQQARVADLVHGIAKQIKYADTMDSDLLRKVLRSLHPLWLRACVCKLLLEQLDDYLLIEEQGKPDQTISLSYIVSHCFFLLPRLCSKGSVQEEPSSSAHEQRKAIRSKRILPTRSQSNSENAENDVAVNCSKLSMDINKRNNKGEGPLHIACMKNDITKVKQLLSLPGIDVNARDYAGWTPLHEACNHGNIQCVKELLSFVPAKTMEHYFKKDGFISKKVDLLAVTGEGITPLHDAVLNNKIEVCRLLLQHGGTKLLSSKTALNFTPVDLASSEEMFQLLSSFQVSTHRNFQRIDSLNSSQDSITSTDDIRTNPPSEQLYEEALQFNGTKLHATKKDILNYIDIVTCLFVSYVEAAELVQVKSTIPKVAKNSSISRCMHKAAIQLRQATGLAEANSQNIEATLSKTETKLERLKMLYPLEDVQILKQDIRTVSKLGDYLEMFQSHLIKISNPEDAPFIQNGLTEIAWMIEILQN
ncbi:hypothetical protein CHS0354_022391 [Potamilus streckersoni]|uniref:BRCT domain-containing protein n=1 Tax=Potamilus streckersoni TaxID=2493646 RepID=A0AAE0SXY4_9BIVA|nr:hypothetical protein CHS0354_022391 [Potamilus streckersoni]